MNYKINENKLTSLIEISDYTALRHRDALWVEILTENKGKCIPGRISILVRKWVDCRVN